LIVKIDNISKQFGDINAVSNFKAELTEGVYGLLGPNGSGKTTLLRMMADVLKPDEGNIFVDGKDKNVLDEKYREIIGYLPQECGFYRNFTAMRFLMYISALKGIEKDNAAEKSMELLELVNLKDDISRKIGGFSRGMKQRLGIAQALLNDPRILILDEPTSGLDPKERIRFRNLISQISKDRIVILSTHIVTDIEYIAKDVLLIKKGKLIKNETPETLLKGLEGKVFSAIVSSDMLDELQSNMLVSNIIRRETSVEVRIISDNQPFTNAIIERPRLEDVYLYYFQEEVCEA
jgi:ABC-type multidrug transport system ATPase subunit